MRNLSTTVTGLNGLKDSRYNFDGDLPVESVDRRTVSLLRLILAAAALLISIIDASMPERFVVPVYGVLVGYCLYSLCLYLLALRQAFIIPARYTHWIDVGWYALLVGLSNGTSSIFFFFFFFAILVGSFRWGYKEGIYVTGASAALFITVGASTPLSDEEFELNRFLIRSLYLVVFGHMVAMWGGRELLFRKRLNLLREVSRLSNPRFGINRTIQSIISRLRRFYDADSCLLIAEFTPDSKHRIWRDDRKSGSDIQLTREKEFAAGVAELARQQTILYSSGSDRLFQRSQCLYVDSALETTAADRRACDDLARLLGARSFIVIPIYQHEELVGRLCLTSNRKSFGLPDISFVRQLIEQVSPGIENVQLLDRLASQAAERQRQTTSRDIHDSTIQPYIGLRLGLEAVQLKLQSGQDVESDIQKLVMLADTTISELRGLAKNLRDAEPAEMGSVLIASVKQQALKYQQFYGIVVEVDAPDDFRLNDRLAAEAFQIITEALSNIKRHTSSKNAVVRIFQQSETFFLVIENSNDGTRPVVEFVPKSISGRARSLGGKASTEVSDTLTRVTVAIPM